MIDKKRMHRIARMASKLAYLVFGFSFLCWVMSFCIFPFLFPAPDQVHAIVGAIINLQEIFFTLVPTLFFLILFRYFDGRTQRKKALYLLALDCLFLTFIELTFFLLLVVLSKHEVAAVRLMSCFQAFPTHIQWMACFGVKKMPELSLAGMVFPLTTQAIASSSLVFPIDITSVLASLVLFALTKYTSHCE